MTTAYTSLLGLALPVTGELSGTWGDTVNNSITSLLDTAVAGTTTITADTTLSTTTGAANQARQAILLCSPASANITVTAPAQSKIYTVINTSATYTVTVRGAGPTTGVTIATSESAVIAWNGSDFIRISSNSTFTAPVVIEGTTTSAALRITQLGTGNALLVEDSTNPDSTPFVIDASGAVIAGYTSRFSAIDAIAVQSSGSATQLGFSAYNWNATGIPRLAYYKSTSGTTGTYGAASLANNTTISYFSFYGDDSTAFVEAARITAAVDGTTGVGDMPGRLVFSTTADGASTPTERMRIDNAGRVGIGVTPTAGRTFSVGGSMTGATGAYGSLTAPTVQPDVTANALISASQGATAANGGTPYTITNLVAYTASQGTFNADSTVTTQVGFDATAALIGATNNYGFRGNIASGTGRWNLYMLGTANNYLAGSLGIGSTSITNVSLRVSKNITGATTSYGMYNDGTVQSDVTTTAYGFRTNLNTQATAFTLGSLVHYGTQQGTIGATSAVTNQYGFIVGSDLTGATNNYGFYGNIASGSNRWNFYAAGTADNYFAGNVGIGTNSPAVKLDVSGTMRSTSATITGAAGGTITPTSDSTNQYTITALGAAATIAIPSGTPIDGQKLTIRIKDNGTARALTWTTSAGGYRIIGTTLPVTTVVSKTVYIGCVYNSADSFWDVVAVAQQA